MYKIFADDTLIYDSTDEEYKIRKGLVVHETNKSGSFTFSVYPDHFYYDRFVKLKTIIRVYKSGKINFRGRILNDVSDYWNNKVITCEGELGFLQDSIIRPFNFTGTPEALFRRFIEEHNSQVDTFKRFKIGIVTVVDANDYITRENTEYESTIDNLNNRLVEGTLGGYLYITHGENGTEEIPTLNYLADFTNVSAQLIEFGANLKNYTKTVKAEEIATVIIPLGAEVTEGEKLTISEVNDGKDYILNAEAVAKYGYIAKVVTWDDVTVASNLKRKGEEYLAESIKQSISIEVNPIDLHLIDRSIEPFKIGDYIRVKSVPHNLDSIMLCNKQTLDLLNPENDTLTLGYSYSTFTETSSKIPILQSTVTRINNKIQALNETVTNTEQNADNALKNYENVEKELGQVTGDLEIIAGVVTENARTIATNAESISNNAKAIAEQETDIENLKAVELFKTTETLPTGGANAVQSGACNIAEYKRLKVFYKNTSGHLFETELYTDGNTSVATYLNAQNLELTFANNAFTLALSTENTRSLSVYRIEGYKI